MPVRSLNSSVFKWPDRKAVEKALRRWVDDAVRSRQDISRVGVIGSFARGDWGVGSDLDLVLILKRSDKPFMQRAAEWNTSSLPVPTDVLVYTEEEWEKMTLQAGSFVRAAERDALWLYKSRTS